MRRDLGSEALQYAASDDLGLEYHNACLRGEGAMLEEINFLERTVAVRHSKTDAGRRVIPLNAEAWEAVMELNHRAQQLGATEPDHYIFPACENGKINPTRAQKSWRSAWRSLRKAARLQHLRFHDLRHHAITELAESQASDQTVMAIAGHVSRQMLEHYSHVRLEAKRRAVEALSQRGNDGSYVTKHVTSGAYEQHRTGRNAQKGLVGERGFEPPTPWSRNNHGNPVIDSLSLVLRLRPRFYPVFGP